MGTIWGRFVEKNSGKKSRATVPLNMKQHEHEHINMKNANTYQWLLLIYDFRKSLKMLFFHKMALKIYYTYIYIFIYIYILYLYTFNEEKRNIKNIVTSGIFELYLFKVLGELCFPSHPG